MHYTKFFILLTVLLCLSFLMGCGTAESLKNNKPNVVIIFLDDSGWSDFEPFGQKRIKTPNVTFGGPDRDILFITASKAIYQLKMEVRGASQSFK